MKKFFSLLWVPLALLCITVPIVFPLGHPGYFPSHDGEWAVVRLGDMFREIRDHQFPPRFSGNLNFEYGYPLFNFAYPFPYYLALIIHLMKVSFIDSIKLVFAGGIVVSVALMYLASREFWGNRWAGFISGLLFAYLPYRLVDVYVRGSIGEITAFVWMPLLLYVTTKIYKYDNQPVYMLLGGVSLAALVLSHNIMAILFLPILVMCIIASAWKKYSLYIFRF